MLNGQSNLDITLHVLSLLFCNFINTAAYQGADTSLHLPLAVVLHGLGIQISMYISGLLLLLVFQWIIVKSKLALIGFEPGSSDVGSNCLANCAAISVTKLKKLCLRDWNDILKEIVVKIELNILIVYDLVGKYNCFKFHLNLIDYTSKTFLQNLHCYVMINFFWIISSLKLAYHHIRYEALFRMLFLFSNKIFCFFPNWGDGALKQLFCVYLPTVLAKPCWWSSTTWTTLLKFSIKR